MEEVLLLLLRPGLHAQTLIVLQGGMHGLYLEWNNLPDFFTDRNVLDALLLDLRFWIELLVIETALLIEQYNILIFEPFHDSVMVVTVFPFAEYKSNGKLICLSCIEVAPNDVFVLLDTLKLFLPSYDLICRLFDEWVIQAGREA